MIVASLIVSTCQKFGARLANPGEFSKRAVLNGRMDLSKAEAIAALISSKSEDSAKILAKQLRGDLGEFVESLRESLVEVLAYVEVNIDYAEEDLDPNLLDMIDKKLDKSITILQKSINVSNARSGVLNGFKIAIIGKPNVGKSSLLNSLLSYNRAITSDIAGTTRDTIEEEIKIGTHLVKIVDTAGIRVSDDELEMIGIKRSQKAIDESEIVLALFDRSREFDEDDEKILELIKNNQEDKKIITLLNKCDLDERFDKEILSSYNPLEITKDDVTAVIDKLQSYLDTQNFDDDIVLINKRQIDATKEAYESLILAKSELDQGELELFSFNLNRAIESISSITRAFERDEILDSMFGAFCLGK